MNVGSLFSGIGGLDLGLHRAGWNHVFFCESDSYRRDVLRARWPGVPVYEDVATIGSANPVEYLQQQRPADGGIDVRLHLLCGGFPCQDLSVAGRRAGLAGERSGLFHEFARIAESLRPRWLLVENVLGLLSSNGGRDFGVVLGTLADLGYGVAWRILDSRYFGVPQRRRRVFILATLANGDPRAAAERAGEVLAVGARCDRHSSPGGEAEQEVAYALADGTGKRTGSGRDKQDTLIAFVSENQRAEVLETPYARQLTSGGGKPGQGYPMIRDRTTVRRLTPTECERLQALPDDWTQLGGTPDSRRYAALGDAVTASVAEWIGRRLAAA